MWPSFTRPSFVFAKNDRVLPDLVLQVTEFYPTEFWNSEKSHDWSNVKFFSRFEIRAKMGQKDILQAYVCCNENFLEFLCTRIFRWGTVALLVRSNRFGHKGRKEGLRLYFFPCWIFPVASALRIEIFNVAKQGVYTYILRNWLWESFSSLNDESNEPSTIPIGSEGQKLFKVEYLGKNPLPLYIGAIFQKTGFIADVGEPCAFISESFGRICEIKILRLRTFGRIWLNFSETYS